MMPDTVYTPTPKMGGYRFTRPWSSNEERLTTEALSVAAVPGVVLQQQVRPPLPQIQLFPDRFGYPHRVLGISDVLDVDATFPQSRVDFSGRSSGYSGSSFPTLAQY